MERKINQTVEVKEVFFDEDLYPRSSFAWQTAYDYAQSMLSGAKFPPITLAVYNKKKYLVDGKHRIEALRRLKEKKVDAEIYVGWDLKKIYEEAVKRNIAHGRVLSPFEKRRIALKLRSMNYPDDKIGELIQVPIGRLQNFIAQRLTSSLTGETIVKSEIKHLAGQEYSGELESTQKEMYSRSQVSILKEVIRLLENDLLNKDSKEVTKLLSHIKELI
jgi:hypothetical protein